MSCPNEKRQPSLLFTRREFLETSLKTAACLAAGPAVFPKPRNAAAGAPAVVSIVRIKNDNIGLAVEKAIDLLCSVPVMKTHMLAQVTLGMKNLTGLYPGTVYNAVRWLMHERASEIEPSGTAVAIIDMVRANKLGLVVIDASTAMEGNGPTQGSLVKMGLIIAGTNPLATDMIAASCMGFKPEEIPTFYWANKAGLTPSSLDEIEVRGETPEQVKRPFVRPKIYAWKELRDVWGVKEV